jgi:hypothetical protein
MIRLASCLTLVPTPLHAGQEVEARLQGAGALAGPVVLTIGAFERRLADRRRVAGAGVGPALE